MNGGGIKSAMETTALPKMTQRDILKSCTI